MDIEALYTTYGPMVLRRCRALLKDPHQALEATQDVFVELLRRRDTLTLDHPSSALYRIATNRCLNLLRSKRRHPEELDHDLLLSIACAPTSEVRAIANRLLIQLFDAQPSLTQQMAVLHWVDGLTYAEVGAMLNLSGSAVRKRLALMRAEARHLAHS